MTVLTLTTSTRRKHGETVRCLFFNRLESWMSWLVAFNTPLSEKITTHLDRMQMEKATRFASRRFGRARISPRDRSSCRSDLVLRCRAIMVSGCIGNSHIALAIRNYVLMPASLQGMRRARSGPYRSDRHARFAFAPLMAYLTARDPQV